VLGVERLRIEDNRT